MTCTVQARQTVRDARSDCRDHDAVRHAYLLSPAQSEQSRWSLALYLDGLGVSPDLQQELAAHDLSIVDVSPRGDAHRAVACIV